MESELSNTDKIQQYKIASFSMDCSPEWQHAQVANGNVHIDPDVAGPGARNRPGFTVNLDYL